MRVLVANHQSGVVFFINKEILVNLPLIQVIMTVMILDHQAVVEVVFLQGKKVQRVKKRKGEKLQGPNNQRCQILKNTMLK
jgi:hypothetical protein